MCEVESLIKWLEVEVVPKVVDSLDKQYHKVKCTWLPVDNCYFLSYVFFVDLSFVDEVDNVKETLSLVMKTPPPFTALIERFRTEILFENEIIFYQQIAYNYKCFPKFFCGTTDKIDRTVIVMENLCKMGFKMCPKSYDIPYKYVINAVREIGRFHGMGYVMKKYHSQRLNTVLKRIKDSRLIAGNWLHDTIKIVGTRPVEWLRKINYNRDFCDQMDDYLGDAFNTIVLDAVKPVEPLAVLCHGDFTRSNIFFRETSADIDTMLIDFGMIRYASPSIDLSTFLFLNTSSKDRMENFNEIFSAYHDALLDYLREAGFSDVCQYSLNNMLEDYKRRAAYGFIVALYFLPVLRGFCDVNQDNNNRPHHKDAAMMIRAAGGDVMSSIFADMLLELLDTGCLDHIIG